MPKSALVLVNTGSPREPTPEAVREFLREFLSDDKVINLPRWFWLPILHGMVLPFRPKESARRYQKIWMPGGSPQVVYMRSIAKKLRVELSDIPGVEIFCAFRYGEDSLKKICSYLVKKGFDQADFLPMYPQYAVQTVGSVHEIVAKALKDSPIRRRFIEPYGGDSYAKLVASSVKKYGTGSHLVISFHGVPEESIGPDNPYDKSCSKFAELVASSLGLGPSEWSVAYQSKFGHCKWLGPELNDVLTNLTGRGTRAIDIISPSFSCDCIETLEEICVETKNVFLERGGNLFNYIPCPNDNGEAVRFYASLIRDFYKNPNECARFKSLCSSVITGCPDCASGRTVLYANC